MSEIDCSRGYTTDRSTAETLLHAPERREATWLDHYPCLHTHVMLDPRHPQDSGVSPASPHSHQGIQRLQTQWQRGPGSKHNCLRPRMLSVNYKILFKMPQDPNKRIEQRTNGSHRQPQGHSEPTSGSPRPCPIVRTHLSLSEEGCRAGWQMFKRRRNHVQEKGNKENK